MRKLAIVLAVGFFALLLAPLTIAWMLVMLDADERYATERADAEHEADDIERLMSARALNTLVVYDAAEAADDCIREQWTKTAPGTVWATSIATDVLSDREYRVTPHKGEYRCNTYVPRHWTIVRQRPTL